MRTLLLAGTREARLLARALKGHEITVSLAGVTTGPREFDHPLHIGGFGGVQGLIRYLRDQRFQAVIDATHPHAARMPWHAHAACAALGLPRLRLMRPAWPVAPEWILAEDAAGAAQSLPKNARALVTLGRGGLRLLPSARIFSSWPGQSNPSPLPRHISTLCARPPFSFEEETALMRRHAITHLVCRNAGGGGRAKLDAAAHLGIGVVMIARPPCPPGQQVADWREAAAWYARTAPKN